MYQPTFILWIIAAVALCASIIWLILYIRRKRQYATFPVSINYVSRDTSPKGPFLYLELDVKNMSGKSIFVSEVQQRHIKGPLETFLLHDAEGKTKRSLFEINEHFPEKTKIKNGISIYRYYQMKLKSSMIVTKLFLQYRVIGSASVLSNSNAFCVVPWELEQKLNRSNDFGNVKNLTFSHF